MQTKVLSATKLILLQRGIHRPIELIILIILPSSQDRHDQSPLFNSWQYQFDVKNEFLHEQIEEVYMKALPGFNENYITGEACKLKK